MKTLLCLRTFLAALAAPLLLASCALPAPDAWRVIRNDGFFSYLSIELGHKPIPPGLSVSPRPALLAQQQPMISVPWRATPNRYWDTNPTKPVAGPPKVIAPAPAPTIAVAPKPIMRTLPPKPAVTSTPAPVVKPAPAPSAAEKPELKAKPAPKVATAPQAPLTPQPAPTKPAVASAPTPPPAPTQPAVATAINELPYGEVIAGRPGFVHSPFAMKTQIVDVTGLRPGQEVKCPFTGKLFRVPPGEQASAKPVEEKK